jgi:menaquinol-cytochrome c reductase iron-sulfur subunit
MPKQPQSVTDRRKAFRKMGKLLLAGGGALAATWFALGREGPIDDWVEVANIKDLPQGVVQPRLVRVLARGKWFDQHVERSVWLLRNPDDTITVLSGVCPHKNYNINWRTDLGTFVCPGHKSAFDSGGRVLSGPSPRPLDALEHQVENGVVKVRYQKFKQNVPTKEIFT